MSDATDQAQGRHEFRQHHTLVLAAAIGFAFSSIVSSSAGIFMEPIGKEFGWNRTLLSSATSITALFTFFLSPFFGVLIDRLGTRRMALVGIVFASLILASISLQNGSPAMWIGTWLVYAFAGVMIKSTVWSAAVSSVFDKARGLALGFTLSGTAVAVVVVPPVTNALIDDYGWRAAWVWLGLGGGAIAFTFCLFWLFDGYDIAKAKRKKSGGEVKSGALLDVPGLSIPQAWRSPALWKIGIALFIIMTITIGLNVHQFEILRGIGVDRTSAAYYVSLTGIAGVIGKLVTGWLLDRYHARWVGSITLGITALTFILLLLPNQSVPIILTAMIVNGYAAGTKLQIASFLTSAYGGMRNFGAIFGTMASLIAAGSGLGPVLGGVIFDRFGNYVPFLILGIVGTLVSALLVFAAGAYPEWMKDHRSSRGIRVA